MLGMSLVVRINMLSGMIHALLVNTLTLVMRTAPSGRD